MIAPQNNTEQQAQAEQQPINPNQLTINSLINVHSILVGLQKVLDRALVPGELSAELHNGRVHTANMIRDIAFQVEQLRDLSKVKSISEAKEKKAKEKAKNKKK